MGEAEDLMRRLNEYYGSSYAPQGKLTVRDGKLFLYAGGETRLKTVWRGLHIANADLSLTIEGAQLLGTTASRCVVDVTEKQARSYYLGGDIPGHEGTGFCILKAEGIIAGPGLLEAGKVKNVLPESRKTRY